jgi:hypothetical protein
MESATYLDHRTWGSLAAAPKDPWGVKRFASGKNHRKDGHGGVVRDEEGQSIWYVEIDTLESLCAFNVRYGDLIIKECTHWKGYDSELEIYDDYRE